MKIGFILYFSAISLAAISNGAFAQTDEYRDGYNSGLRHDFPEECPTNRGDFSRGCSVGASESEMDDEEETRLHADEDAQLRALEESNARKEGQSDRILDDPLDSGEGPNY